MLLCYSGYWDRVPLFPILMAGRRGAYGRLMSKSVEFIVILDDGVRKRHRHETNGGKVINFVVQLEIRIEQEWKVVIRYDCAHGYSHADRYDKTGKQTKRPLNLQFESALTYGDWDINENWQHYRDAFMKGRRDE